MTSKEIKRYERFAGHDPQVLAAMRLSLSVSRHHVHAWRIGTDGVALCVACHVTRQATPDEVAVAAMYDQSR